MREKFFTILSTAVLPTERLPPVPDSVQLEVIPFTSMIPRTDDQLKKLVNELAPEKKSVIFTSAYAVKFIAGMLAHKPHWDIYCIRNETRAAVIEYFGNECIRKFAGNASALANEIITDQVKEAVFFCGDQRLETIPDQLKKKGIPLQELIVYDTRLTPETIKTTPDAVLFFSPTAVNSFFSVNNLSPDTLVFAMGSTTAKSLEEIKNPVVISSKPDKAFVVQMALNYAVSHPIIEI